MPGLRSAPQKAARDRSSVSVRWDAWSRSLDSGSGPVTAYVVYYTNALAQRWTSVRTDYTQVTVDDLKQLRSYRFKVAPVHKLGFEGRASPELMVSTCGSRSWCKIIINSTVERLFCLESCRIMFASEAVMMILKQYSDLWVSRGLNCTFVALHLCI